MENSGSSIKNKVLEVLSELPRNVEVVAAAKTRTPFEIMEAVNAGIRIIGENYVQEAEKAFQLIGEKARWHFIGHLQKNKVKKAVAIFDMIETVDSLDLAKVIDNAAGALGKKIDILIEINSGREEQKSGVLPENACALIEELTAFKNIKVRGLMTMGPLSTVPEDYRPYFRATRGVFDQIREKYIDGVEMRFLSMGMSDSYKVAIEEGANLVRLGTKIFGKRK